MKVLNLAYVAIFVTFCMGFNSRKKDSPTIYSYISGTNRQRIEYGHTTETDLKERSPESNSGADFKDVNNWTKNSVTYTSTTDMSKYLGAIVFTEDDVNPPNGGADGDLTLQEALNALYTYYANNHGFGNGSFIADGNASITLDAATAAH